MFRGHAYTMTCLTSPPFSCTCTEDATSRTFNFIGLCESADVVSKANDVWAHTCGFP
jgi:hypothetical protein